MTITIQRILVPVDFSECSRVALQHAIHFGNLLQATTVDVLHVWTPPAFIDPQTKVQGANGQEATLTEFVASQAGQAMKDFLAQVEQGGAFDVHGRLEAGQPHLSILEVARREKYELIVMGTHGERRDAKLGSVAEKVVRNAVCPVLTIPAS